jgi:hypothetical protein
MLKILMIKAKIALVNLIYKIILSIILIFNLIMHINKIFKVFMIRIYIINKIYNIYNKNKIKNKTFNNFKIFIYNKILKLSQRINKVCIFKINNYNCKKYVSFNKIKILIPKKIYIKILNNKTFLNNSTLIKINSIIF